MERLKTFSRIGLAAGVALGMAHEVLTSPAEAAGPCTIRVGGSVHRYIDQNGNNQYDRGEPVTGGKANQEIIIKAGGQQRTLITDSQGRTSYAAITGLPDATFQGRPALKVEMTFSGRGEKPFEIPCNTQRNGSLYLKETSTSISTPSPFPPGAAVLTHTVRIERGGVVELIHNTKDWWWLVWIPTVLGAAWLVGRRWGAVFYGPGIRPEHTYPTSPPALRRRNRWDRFWASPEERRRISHEDERRVQVETPAPTPAPPVEAVPIPQPEVTPEVEELRRRVEQLEREAREARQAQATEGTPSTSTTRRRPRGAQPQ